MENLEISIIELEGMCEVRWEGNGEMKCKLCPMSIPVKIEEETECA